MQPHNSQHSTGHLAKQSLLRNL